MRKSIFHLKPQYSPLGEWEHQSWRLFDGAFVCRAVHYESGNRVFDRESKTAAQHKELDKEEGDLG
jgi:hypothetical protein